MSKSIIGIVMMIAGIVLGLYLGIWWAFIGGIVQVINEIRADDLSAINVAIGIFRFFALPLYFLAAR